MHQLIYPTAAVPLVEVVRAALALCGAEGVTVVTGAGAQAVRVPDGCADRVRAHTGLTPPPPLPLRKPQKAAAGSRKRPPAPGGPVTASGPDTDGQSPGPDAPHPAPDGPAPDSSAATGQQHGVTRPVGAEVEPPTSANPPARPPAHPGGRAGAEKKTTAPARRTPRRTPKG